MKISFVGDVCLHSIRDEQFAVGAGVARLLGESDLAVANLESPLTDAETKRRHQPIHLKGRSADVAILGLFDVFSLANNHIMDYEGAGLADTVRHLEAMGKYHFGAGDTLAEARRPLRVDVGPWKLAFLGLTRWYNARRQHAGTRPDRVGALVRDIRTLKREGCTVIVMPHWNYEYVDYPAPANRRLARHLARAGADVIAGAHPHVVQGIESIGSTLVAHSQGNFVFDQSLMAPGFRDDPRVRETFILTVTLRTSGEHEWAIAPVVTDGGSVRLATDGAAQGIRERIEALSLALADERECSRRFYRASAALIRLEMATMRGLVKDQGIWSVLGRLHRVRLQDLKVKLHALFEKE